MLSGESGLRLFDLLLGFLFAVAGGKEDVVRVGALPLEFIAMAFPVILVILFMRCGKRVSSSLASQRDMLQRSSRAQVSRVLEFNAHI